MVPREGRGGEGRGVSALIEAGMQIKTAASHALSSAGSGPKCSIVVNENTPHNDACELAKCRGVREPGPKDWTKLSEG